MHGDAIFSRHTDFTGRMWLREDVFKQLERNPHGVILVAEPGFGKSAFVADLIKNYPSKKNLPLLGYHICQYDSPSSVAASTFVSYLAMRLRLNNREYANFLKYNMSKDTKEKIENICKEDAMRCFDSFIRYPLSQIQQKSGNKNIFVIDALDECKWTGFRFESDMSVSDLLTKRYREFSKSIKLFITSRNETSVLRRFSAMETLNVYTDNPGNKKDMHDLIRTRSTCTDDEIYSIAKKSNYNALVINYYVSQASSHCPSFHDVPGTIHEMFDMEFSRLYGSDFEGEFVYDRALFEIIVSNVIISNHLTLCVAKHLLKYFDKPMTDDYVFDRMLRRISPHLIRITHNEVDEETIQFYHSSLKEWLLARKGLSFYVNPKSGHFAWAKYLHKKLSSSTLPDCSIFYNENQDKNMVEIFETIALAMHILQSKNNSLQREVVRGTLTVPTVKKTNSEYGGKLSFDQVGIAYFLMDSYDTVQLLMALVPKADRTSEAFVATAAHNVNSLRALLENGRVNLQYKHNIPALNISHTFHENIPDDLISIVGEKEFIFSGTKLLIFSEEMSKILTAREFLFHKPKYVNKTFKSRDSFTLLHAFIETGNMDGIQLLLSINKSLIFDITGNGLSSLDLAVESDDIDIFVLIRDIIKPKNDFWFLYYASIRGRYKILLLLLHIVGVSDKCPVCHSNFRKNGDLFTVLPSNATISLFSNFTDNQKQKLKQEILCESALIAAIKTGKDTSVYFLLGKSTNQLECPDASGMTPFAAAVFYKREYIMELLIYYSANIDFRIFVDPNYSDRARLIDKYLLMSGDEDLKLLQLIDGAGFTHFASLRPSCFASSLLLKLTRKAENKLPAFLDTKDAHGRTPLYYSLCHPLSDNTYHTLLSFKTPRAHRMALFLIMIARGHANTETLHDIGLCGPTIERFSIYNIPPRFCDIQMQDFPKLQDIYFKDISKYEKIRKFIQNTILDDNFMKTVMHVTNNSKISNFITFFIDVPFVSKTVQENIQIGISIFGEDNNEFRRSRAMNLKSVFEGNMSGKDVMPQSRQNLWNQ